MLLTRLRISQLMQHGEIIAVCSEIDIKHTKIYCVGGKYNVLTLNVAVRIITRQFENVKQSRIHVMSRLPTTSYGVKTVWKIGGGEMCIRSIMNKN